jgi:type VI protein secretion system component VasF
VSRYTPGPWAAEPQLTPDGRMGDAWNVIADDRPAVPVAEVRREADARLIAAAPKLLSALQDIARYTGQTHGDAARQVLDENARIARAAIAAAGVDP